MQTVCPQCAQTLTWESQAPKFCQHCGCSVLASSTASNPPPLAASPHPQAGSSGQGEPTIQDPNQTVPPQNPGNGATAWEAADMTVAPSTSPLTTVNHDHSVGEHVGPYETVDWLGSGGMGNVWQAVEMRTGRRVALKRLASSMVSDQASMKRFNQEAQLAAKISHPHVTFIYGTGQHQGAPYIAMELMPGNTLEDVVLEEGPMDVKRAVDYMLDVIDGLEAVHQKGLMHRDIKPSNCFLDTDDSIKIGDFGLSKSVDNDDANLTKTGTFMGTPSYASPEQIRGIDVDERTDQYSVGATLYFLLTGETPYRGDATSMMAQIIGDPPPSVRARNSELPRDLDAIIRRTLAKSADDRFETLGHLKVALLPYTSRFNSVADAGRRLAAYMIDQSMMQIIVAFSIVLVIIVAMVRAGGPLSQEVQAKYQYWSSFASFVAMYLYYVICEGRFGRTLGKRLMGLKLVDYEGQTAGIWRAAIRAAFVPAGLGIPAIFAWQQYRAGDLVAPTNPAEMIFAFSIAMLMGFGPVLFCLTTMRRSNRLRGLHGMVSGTRVVRAAQAASRTALPTVILNIKQVEPMEFGPYCTDKMLGECEYGIVYLARDAKLNRDVWIVAREGGQSPPEERISLARHARQRWLDGGACAPNANGQCLRWDAVEAVVGIPIQQYIGMAKKDRCSGYAKLMRQLVRELRSAIKDNTLPETMGLSQVWIEQGGSIKLLDSQLVKTVHASELDTSVCLLSGERQANSQSPETRAVELVQQLGDVMHRGRVLPLTLAEFLTELYDRPKTVETLEWADEQLGLLEDRTTRLRWDNRIGILAVTMGVEALAFSMIAALIMLVSYYFAPVEGARQTAVYGVLASLALPMSLAAYFNGGFVFHIMGFRVTGLKGQPASPVIKALRAGISWLPFFVLGGAIMLLMIFADATMHEELANQPGTVDYEVTHDEELPLIAMLAVMGSLATMTAGILFSIFSPKRGLADYLLGTRLMPE